jgi:hypothetical protein
MICAIALPPTATAGTRQGRSAGSTDETSPVQ